MRSHGGLSCQRACGRDQRGKIRGVYERAGPELKPGVAVRSLFEDPAARERLALLLALGLAVTLAWGYLLYMGWGMEHMDEGVHMAIMPRMTDWGAIDLALVFMMWAIMMMAMMLPSATPMILIFTAVDRQRQEAHAHLVHVLAFVAGYIAVWTAFSLFATLVQWGLLEARLVSPMMQSSSPIVGGLLLTCAGAYQFTALKRACLATCRSPLAFILSQWRSGASGAFVMGLRHGAYCAGCCWLLMALLFVLGVMNVLWIVALTVFVLVEKTLPRARWLGFATGAMLIAWGTLVLYGAVHSA
jgi:predicted metal-binding membrane protein